MIDNKYLMKEGESLNKYISWAKLFNLSIKVIIEPSPRFPIGRIFEPSIIFQENKRKEYDDIVIINCTPPESHDLHLIIEQKQRSNKLLQTQGEGDV